MWRRVSSSTGCGRPRRCGQCEKRKEEKKNIEIEMKNYHKFTNVVDTRNGDSACSERLSEYVCVSVSVSAFRINSGNATRKNSGRRVNILNGAGWFWYVIAISLSQDSLISMSSFLPSIVFLPHAVDGRLVGCGRRRCGLCVRQIETEESKTISVRTVSADWRRTAQTSRAEEKIIILICVLRMHDVVK